ncbi:MAG: O-antigen ligase family protein [Lachnospiraceae bacterium]|nr:O-antigen ligase family protein [Lachnospiraceae bacterium]
MTLWAISPPFMYSGVARALVLLGVGAFLAVSYDRFSSDSKYVFITLGALIAYIYFVSFITGESVSSRTIPLIIFLCNVLFFLYYKYNEKELKELKSILWIALILNTTFNITTLIGYNTKANVSRLLAKNFDGAEVYARQGIGGFGFVYTTLLILPFDFTILKNKELRLIYKVIVIAHIITSIYMILSSGYTLAVIGILIIVAVSLIFSNKAGSADIFKRFVLIAIVCAVLFWQWGEIKNGLESISEGTMYEDKVHDLLYGVDDNDEGSFGVREERYQRSINSFLEHPLFGSGNFVSVGKHSFLLDTYGQYGFFVGTAFVIIITMSARYYYKKKNVAKKLSILELILPLILLTLNSMVFAFGIVLFILYPIVVYNYCEEKKIEESKRNYSGLQRREIHREMS